MCTCSLKVLSWYGSHGKLVIRNENSYKCSTIFETEVKIILIQDSKIIKFTYMIPLNENNFPTNLYKSVYVIIIT